MLSAKISQVYLIRVLLQTQKEKTRRQNELGYLQNRTQKLEGVCVSPPLISSAQVLSTCHDTCHDTFHDTCHDTCVRVRACGYTWFRYIYTTQYIHIYMYTTLYIYYILVDVHAYYIYREGHVKHRRTPNLNRAVLDTCRLAPDTVCGWLRTDL